VLQSQVTAGSDEEVLHPGVVLVSIGTRYAFYCANLSRT
jgi:nucleosome binding factor SPN SPT16 subunit